MLNSYVKVRLMKTVLNICHLPVLVVFERLVDIICETMAESTDGVDANGAIAGQSKGQRLTNGDVHAGGIGSGDRSGAGCNC